MERDHTTIMILSIDIILIPVCLFNFELLEACKLKKASVKKHIET